MTKTGRRRTGASTGRDRGSRTIDPTGDGGPDEAADLIAGAAADLAKMARRHKLGMLAFLLGMAQLEAEDHVRLRSKRNLS